MDRVFVTVQKYGNMSAATVPVALVDAVESGRVKRRTRCCCTPAFGAGLTWCSHLIRWGERVTPHGTDIDLPPCDRSALEMVNALRAAKVAKARSLAGLNSPTFPGVTGGRCRGLIRGRRLRPAPACGAPARSSGCRAR